MNLKQRMIMIVHVLYVAKENELGPDFLTRVQPPKQGVESWWMIEDSESEEYSGQGVKHPNLFWQI